MAVEHILSGNHLRFANKYRVCDLNFFVSTPKNIQTEFSSAATCHLPLARFQLPVSVFCFLSLLFRFCALCFSRLFRFRAGASFIVLVFVTLFRRFSLIFVAFSPSNKNRRPLSVVNFKATPHPLPPIPTHVFCFVCSVIEAAKGSVYSATLLHTADLKLSLRRALHLFGTRDFA